MSKLWQKLALILALALSLALSGGMAGIAGAVAYRYEDLSLQGLGNSLFITAINDSAWVVGYYYHPSAHTNQPFVWRPGVGQTDLQNPSYPLAAYAHGINNQGQIVGQANSLSLPGIDACYWSSPAAAPAALPTTGASLYENCAYGINEAGEVAGEGQFGDPLTAPIHAARWPANHSTATDLGTLGEGSFSYARSINRDGWAVGYSENLPTPSHGFACLWVPGQQPQQIPSPIQPGPAIFDYANVITDQANVLGHAMYGEGAGLAFFRDHQTGVSQLILPNAYSALAAGMSEANQVVGYYEIMEPPSWGLFYWTPGGESRDLNQMVVNLPPGVSLWSVSAISRNGRYITGFDSQGHPYLLTAVAMPPIGLLLLN